MESRKKKLKLSRTAILKLNEESLNRVAGGPGHGQTNRCCPFTWPFCMTNCDSICNDNYCPSQAQTMCGHTYCEPCDTDFDPGCESYHC